MTDLEECNEWMSDCWSEREGRVRRRCSGISLAVTDVQFGLAAARH